MQNSLLKLKSTLYACMCVVSLTMMMLSMQSEDLQIRRQNYIEHDGIKKDLNYMNQAKSPFVWNLNCSGESNKTLNYFQNNVDIKTGVSWYGRSLIKQTTKLRYLAFDQVISEDEFNDMIAILTTFKTVCENNGLMYMLYGGSLLGSYRHFGLIPWDDDIDIFMNASERNSIRVTLSNVPGFN